MHTGRGPCEVEGRYWVMYLEAKEHQRLPAKHQKLGEKHGTNSFSQTLEGTNPADTLISAFWPLEL